MNYVLIQVQPPACAPDPISSWCSETLIKALLHCLSSKHTVLQTTTTNTQICCDFSLLQQTTFLHPYLQELLLLSSYFSSPFPTNLLKGVAEPPSSWSLSFSVSRPSLPPSPFLSRSQMSFHFNKSHNHILSFTLLKTNSPNCLKCLLSFLPGHQIYLVYFYILCHFLIPALLLSF